MTLQIFNERLLIFINICIIYNSFKIVIHCKKIILRQFTILVNLFRHFIFKIDFNMIYTIKNLDCLTILL